MLHHTRTYNQYKKINNNESNIEKEKPSYISKVAYYDAARSLRELMIIPSSVKNMQKILSQV